MDQLIDIVGFFNRPWVGSALGFFGLILTIVGIYSFKFARSMPKPIFQRYSLRLIGKEEDSLPVEVEVLYKGKAVQRLTKTVLIFWNAGTEVLRGEDIVQADP